MTATIAATVAAQKVQVVARRLRFGLAERRQALADLRRAIIAHEADLQAAVAQDMGKHPAEFTLLEIVPTLAEITHARRALPGWMRARRQAGGLAGLGTVARLRPEAKGAALIIAPWNYPVSLALGPLVSALAAGCSAVLKPSELTPATSAVLARLVASAFPPDLVTVIEGGKEVAEELLAQPFDHIFFTGSPEVGRIVMAAAARTLASVTLELGGKSPAIVGPGADLARAARWIAFGKFSNAGQTCIAPDHVFVADSVAGAFGAELRRAIAGMYPKGLGSPDLAQIVSPRHAARLTWHLAEAQAQGARLVLGGASEARRIEPTLIEALAPDCALDREEIFGPILPIIRYGALDELIGRINARPKPLALYVFDTDRSRIDRIIAETSSGSVGVNLTLLQFSHAGLPFGGVNSSGIGAAHGHWGFRAFSHEKAVLENRFSPLSLLFPPYGRRARRMIGLVRRFLT